jgi:hypothetical protein
MRHETSSLCPGSAAHDARMTPVVLSDEWPSGDETPRPATVEHPVAQALQKMQASIRGKNLESNSMKKSLLIAACGVACIASSAFAQVGLGGGAVGSLGANGTASSVGGLGSGIRSGATARGADLRDTGQLDGSAQTRDASAGTSAGIDARASGSGIRADTAGAAGASANAPIVSGSSWGTAPDLVDLKDDTKNDVKGNVHGREERTIRKP